MLNGVFGYYVDATHILVVAQQWAGDHPLVLSLSQDADGNTVIASDGNSSLNGGSAPVVIPPDADLANLNISLVNNPHQLQIDLQLPGVALNVTEGSGGGTIAVTGRSQFKSVTHRVGTTNASFSIGV